MKVKSNTWNYRVMSSHTNGLGIYEVYYDTDGNIEYFSSDIIAPKGDSLEELKEDLSCYIEALNKPVLDYDKLTKQFMNSSIDKNKTDLS